MEAMCHTLRERKSKSLDKGIRCEKIKQMRKGHVARRKVGGIFHLNQVGTIRWESRENEGKKKKEKKRKKKKR